MPIGRNLARIDVVNRLRGPIGLCVLVLGAAAPMLSGCDALKNLRKLFHPDEEIGGLGQAGLRIEVEPPEGISILLDETRVASVSPYVNRKLKAGPHVVEVRAMGYYSVRLPLTLVDHKLVTIPVALRPRPSSEARGTPPSSKPKPPEPPPPPSAVLPTGIPPVTLTLAPSPEVPIALDRVSAQGRQIQLQRFDGELSAGPISLRYSVGRAGILTLQVPSDGATWSKDGAPLRSGVPFKLHQGVVRLKRTARDGSDQSLLIRR